MNVINSSRATVRPQRGKDSGRDSRDGEEEGQKIIGLLDTFSWEIFVFNQLMTTRRLMRMCVSDC